MNVVCRTSRHPARHECAKIFSSRKNYKNNRQKSSRLASPKTPKMIALNSFLNNHTHRKRERERGEKRTQRHLLIQISSIILQPLWSDRLTLPSFLYFIFFLLLSPHPNVFYPLLLVFSALFISIKNKYVKYVEWNTQLNNADMMWAPQQKKNRNEMCVSMIYFCSLLSVLFFSFSSYFLLPPLFSSYTSFSCHSNRLFQHYIFERGKDNTHLSFSRELSIPLSLFTCIYLWILHK